MSKPEERIAQLNAAIADLVLQLQGARNETAKIRAEAERYHRWWMEETRETSELREKLAQFTDAKTSVPPKSDV